MLGFRVGDASSTFTWQKKSGGAFPGSLGHDMLNVMYVVYLGMIVKSSLKPGTGHNLDEMDHAGELRWARKDYLRVISTTSKDVVH